MNSTSRAQSDDTWGRLIGMRMAHLFWSARFCLPPISSYGCGIRNTPLLSAEFDHPRLHFALSDPLLGRAVVGRRLRRIVVRLARSGKSRDVPHRGNIPPREEVRRIAILWIIIGATSLSIYIQASFWPNWDAPGTRLWSAIPRSLRLTSRCSISSSRFWWCSRSRLPLWPLQNSCGLCSRKGLPVVIFPVHFGRRFEFVQVAFNEWGHSLWLSEEFFAVPFHCRSLHTDGSPAACSRSG